MGTRDQTFYTITPGSAVADQLQDILARKRSESRQSMLDQIAEQERAKNDQYRQAQLAGLEEQRLGQAQLRQAQTGQIDAEAARKAQHDEAIKNFVNPANPDFAKLDPAVQAQMRFAVATGNPQVEDQVLANMGQKPNPADQSVPVFVNGKATGEWAPPNALHMTVPQEPQDHGTVYGQATGPDGKPIPGQFLVMRNGKLQMQGVQGATGVHREGTANPAKSTMKQMTSQDRANLSKLRGKASSSGLFGLGGASSTDKAALKQFVDSYISTDQSLSQDVKDTVYDALQREPGASPEQLIGKFQGQWASPAEEAQFANTVRMFFQGQ